MLCRNCGKEIDASAAFCPYCGASQGAPPTQTGPVYGVQTVPVQKYNGLAVAGFVLSFFGWLSMLGLILSIIGLVQIRGSNGTQKGSGLAMN